MAAVLMGTLPGHAIVQFGVEDGDPYAGPCSGTVSLWCNQNGDGAGFPGRICC